ncbi:MAG: hypothetical protein LBM93_09765 [Oscillospiraceae bacterium]|nr:hypothetical protein [Oscillospiraceae bacterium]
MKEKKMIAKTIEPKKQNKLFSDTIDQLVKEIANTKDWSTLVPDYDEDALMVHWSSKS